MAAILVVVLLGQQGLPVATAAEPGEGLGAPAPAVPSEWVGAPAPAEPPTRLKSPSSSGNTTGGLVLLGCGGAVIALGGVMHALTVTEIDAMGQHANPDPLRTEAERRAAYDSHDAKRSNFRALTYVLYGSGVALAGAGVALLLVGDDKGEPASGLSFGPAPRPGGMGFELRGGF